MSALRDDGIELGRRVYERFAVEIDAEVTSEAGRFTAVTRDVSRGGVCFVVPEPMGVGTPFDISLSLVLGENAFSEALDLRGKVVWCTPIAEGHQIGASFDGLTGETKEYLQMFLSFLAKGLQVEEEEEEEEGDEDADEEKGLFG